MEAMIEGFAEVGEAGGIGKHVVISKVLVSALLVAAVFPAWYWHVVPKALQADEAHEALDEKCRPSKQHFAHPHVPAESRTGDDEQPG
eukprot:CAMPEP_0204172164 /NCGR_PEP_ID=MMETSP0361-20130328/43857_1 /ASSEMBLY_ACC=CAM_ASM_000343 /TAXON_ID=268821 /ORGANISM="Scrippsiella Hangoei, Strain SHTV-5" /LENGTH=87 /DNA_ID=CAMNT_0051130193 /DNA_START=549 /DNA_END=812 /DNA_ORIENTATION=+